ncbi:hypothetical protein [Streptomyces chryseus]|uniref:hypothetical protein n=1 Tax=Streptomyces chryseus TaxID=68186 RepID=UPI001B884D03|nr:hypothetical protein [Streptomyces chryseus]
MAVDHMEVSLLGEGRGGLGHAAVHHDHREVGDVDLARGAVEDLKCSPRRR